MSVPEFEYNDVVLHNDSRYRVVEPSDGVNVLLTEVGCGRLLRANPAHLQPLRDVPVDRLTGVGDRRADALAEVGITTVGDVVEGGVAGVADAGIPAGHAEKIVAAAEDFINER